MNLIPLAGYVLVRLEQKHKNFQVTEGKFDTRTSGTVISASKSDREFQGLIGKLIYFDEYQEGARITVDGLPHCFIKTEDVRGYSE